MKNKVTRMSPHSRRPLTMSASRPAEWKPRACRRGRFLTGLFGLLAFAGVAASLTPANAFTRDITIVTVTTWIVGADIGTKQLLKVNGPSPMTATLTPTLPNGVTFDATAFTLTGTPTATLSKTQFTLSVIDGDGDRVTYTLPIEVVADLKPAFASGAAIRAQSWIEGTDIGTLRLPAASGGNAPLTYSLSPASTLPNGLTFNPTARTITGTPTATFSKASFTYTATDANGDDARLTFDIEVVADLTPAFSSGVSIPAQSWAEGTAISSLQLPVATGGNAPLTYSLTPAVPTGVTFDAAARTVTGTPTAALSKTQFTYTVTDGDGDTATLTFDIEVAAEPRPAFAQGAAIPAQSWTAGTAISTLQLPVATGGNAPLTYSLTPALPTGLTFNATARTLAGTPTAAFSKTSFTYTVMDANGDTARLTFDIEVAADLTPAFASSDAILAQSWTAGTAIGTLQLPAATGGNAPLTYSLTPALPTGLTFDATARTLAGTPTATLGKTSFTYTVTDGDDDTARLTFDIEVATSVVVAVPGVRYVTFHNSPASGDTYRQGERIEVMAVFDIAVVVTGAPRLELTIGSDKRYASYYNPPGSNDPPETTLVFLYTVQAGDVDTDGFSIAANALAFNGGRISINAGGGISIDAKLDHNAVAPSALRKVDGVVPVVSYTDPTGPWTANQTITAFGPTTTDTDIDSYAVKAGSSLPSGLTLDGTTGEISGTPDTANPNTHATIVVITDKAGNTGETTVTFPAIRGDKPAFAQGAAIPAQSWTQGTAISTLRLPAASGGNAPLTYSLTPTLPAGLTFDATARTVTGTPTAAFSKASFTYTVTDGDGNTARLTFDIEVAASVAVDVPRVSSVAFRNTPARGADTFRQGELIEVEAFFDIAVVVTGAPRVELTIGSDKRYAAYYNPPGPDDTPETRLLFLYRVQAGDVDTDGISIAANTLSLNGGSISINGTDAVLDHDAVAADARRKVDGRTMLAPAVTSLSFDTRPRNRHTYGLGELIGVDVTFSKDVTVTGSPQLGLTIGNRTRQAVYDEGNSNSRTLFFRYDAQVNDRDTDGISIAANAIDLNGGTIMAKADGTTAAVLTHRALADAANRKVDGRTVLVPEVSSISFNNAPLGGDTYGLGEVIELAIAFNASVTVTGSTKLGLLIGTERKQAVYYAGSGSRTLLFRYTVQEGDRDTDGISVPEDAISPLRGETIAATANSATRAFLRTHAVDADAKRKVDGRTVSVPAVSSLSFDNRPLDGDTYGFGEEIEVAIAFNVSVMVTGIPKVGLTIGKRTRQAVYDKDKSDELTLVFFYRVEAGDVDTDGISIAANALALNSGRIWINAGGGIAIDAKLDHDAVAPSALRKVDGVVPEVIYTDPTGTWTANQAITDLEPTTKDIDIASYMVKSGSSLPPGLALDGTTGVISGTPTTANPNPHDTVVVITDKAGNTDETTVTFPVILSDKLAFAQGAAIPSQSWIEGTDIGTLPLPTATGGNGLLTYSLSPAVPTGLIFDSTARTLSGTPTAVFDKATFTYTVSDADGDATTLTFDIEVISPAMAKRQRLRVVNEVVLPELARAMTASTAGAVADRLGSVAPDMGNTGSETLASLAHLLEANEQALNEGDFSWRRALAGKSFALGLSGDGVDGAGPGSGGVAVWGAGDWRNLSLDGPVDWDGDMFAAHLGVDAALGEDVRAGVAVSRFESSIDYTDNGGDAPLKGTHENRMTSVHPYAGLSLPDGSRLWALAGYGKGEIEIDDAEAGRQSSDSTLLTAAAGGTRRLVSEGATAFDLKGEVQGSRLEVDDNGDLIKGLSVRTWRMRLALEGSRDFEWSPDTVLTPSLELGLRWDGGDGETGTGVEIGGGLGYVDRAKGLTAEISARALAAHEGGVREWGASGSFRFDPGADRRGLALSLTSSWGEAGSGVAQLWEDGLTGPAADANGDVPGARIEAELGYGLPAFGGVGLVTPYGGVSLAADGGRRYRVGSRLDLGTGFNLSLEGSRHESRDGTPEHRANLALRMIW